MDEVRIDFKHTTGKIKPLHGLNSGPRNSAHGVNNMENYKAAGIPYARLHDIMYPFGSGHFVDIPCVFSEFDADPENPENYDFRLTDDYLKDITACGTRIIYRLGVSIEHFSKKYHIFPPKDYLQWAKICAGIVRHYTQGWAYGFFYEGMMWEIWNEPDLHRNMWLGTDEEYFELYVVTANYLKSCFPDIIIGGPAATRCSEFTRSFLQYLTKDGRKTPLDFFSWHRYSTSPKSFADMAMLAKEQLAEFGYTDTLNMLNEWNYVISWNADDLVKSYQVIESAKGAAFFTAVVCELQASPVDISVYYGAEIHQTWSGLFGRYAQPLKTYYAAYAFNQLYRLGGECAIEGLPEGVYGIAATGGNLCGVLLTNYDSPVREVSIDITGAVGKRAEIMLLDETHNMEKIAEHLVGKTIKVNIPEDSVVWVRISNDA